MKRNLLNQMKKEWRDNVWLVIELAVVCLAIWGLSVIVYVQGKGLFIPRGFNPENVYSISLKKVSSGSPNYIDLGENAGAACRSDFLELLRRLRENPNVEAVATHWGAIPYNYNYDGRQLALIDGQDSILYFGNTRYGSPDIVNVLQLNSLTGKSRKDLYEMLQRGELLIGNNPNYEESGRNPRDLIGKKVILGGDTSRIYRVGDVIEQVRRTDFEPGWAGGYIVPLVGGDESWGSVAVRVKPGKGMQFKEDFKSNADLRKLRNVYFSDLKSLTDIRESCQRSVEVDIRMKIIIMIFLVLTIFLGLLGSFWFRIQQRISEIAIRKVCGAKRREIFARIITEGLILLLGAIVVVGCIVWPFIGTFENMLFEKWTIFLAAEAFTVLLVAIGIIISLWYPARKAMQIEPAVAIKSE